MWRKSGPLATPTLYTLTRSNNSPPPTLSRSSITAPVSCLLSPACCLLSPVSCLLSSISCLLSSVCCLRFWCKKVDCDWHWERQPRGEGQWAGEVRCCRRWPPLWAPADHLTVGRISGLAGQLCLLSELFLLGENGVIVNINIAAVARWQVRLLLDSPPDWALYANESQWRNVEVCVLLTGSHRSQLWSQPLIICGRCYIWEALQVTNIRGLRLSLCLSHHSDRQDHHHQLSYCPPTSLQHGTASWSAVTSVPAEAEGE